MIHNWEFFNFLIFKICLNIFYVRNVIFIFLYYKIFFLCEIQGLLRLKKIHFRTTLIHHLMQENISLNGVYECRYLGLINAFAHCVYWRLFLIGCFLMHHLIWICSFSESLRFVVHFFDASKHVSCRSFGFNYSICSQIVVLIKAYAWHYQITRGAWFFQFATYFMQVNERLLRDLEARSMSLLVMKSKFVKILFSICDFQIWDLRFIVYLTKCFIHASWLFQILFQIFRLYINILTTQNSYSCFSSYSFFGLLYGLRNIRSHSSKMRRSY